MVNETGDEAIEIALPGAVMGEDDFAFVLDDHRCHRCWIVVMDEAASCLTFNTVLASFR